MTGETWPGVHNDGVIISTRNGSVNISGSAIGTGAMVEGQVVPKARGPVGGWDIGVNTVLSEEARAVADMLRRAGHYTTRDQSDGLRFGEAVLGPGITAIKIAGYQALGPGPLSAGHAFGHLLRYYAPAVVAVAGIAGGIHPSVQLGDVVLALEVIHYDQRKETPEGARRRGSSYTVPAPVHNAINNFLSDRGEPCILTTVSRDGISRAFRVTAGPLGSGEAVVADEDSEIRAYLRGFNDKTLAVETEAAGLARAFYELTTPRSRTRGWLAIRGISDGADADKNDGWHDIASQHAAVVLELLAPYIKRATA